MPVPNAPRRRRNAEIYQRYKDGETQVALADAYGLSRTSIWMICKEEAAYDLPPLEDRKTWRQALAGAYAERIANAGDADTDTFVKLTKGLRELGGLDFKHDLEQRLVQIETQKLQLLTDAVAFAMATANLDPGQRAAFGEALDNRLAELETTG